MRPVELKIVKCPFCNEDDFDLRGLEMHLYRKGCFEALQQDEHITLLEKRLPGREVEG